MRGPVIRAAFSAILVCFSLSVLISLAAQAEIQPATPLGAAAQKAAPPSAFAPPRAAPPQAKGPFGAILTWIAETQQRMQQELAGGVKRLKSGNALAATLALAGLGFLYGIVHAAGPGHGKAIISSYVISNEETVRRGVLISFLAAGVQALTAVALVGIFLVALNATGLELNTWANHLESASYALIALVGLYLLVSQFMRLWRRWRGAAVSGPGHDHGHDNHHHHHHHTGHHDHAHEDGCDHVVDARKLAGPFSWRKAMAVVLSVGIRPCSGAILVLVFALTQGLFWAGVAATFAMALGTAITVAVLATLALGSRELALRLGGGNSGWADAVWTTCAIGGATLILVLGVLLFAASLGPARPF